MTSPSRAVEITFEQVTSGAVRRFDAYWRSKLRPSALPRREDINPADLLSLLPQFILVDIEPEPFRIRYRLCGSDIAQRDEEFTGKYLDELRNTTPEDKAELTLLYRTVVTERRPAYARFLTHSRATGIELINEGAIWPLSNDGTTIDKCAAIQEVSAQS